MAPVWQIPCNAAYLSKFRSVPAVIVAILYLPFFGFSEEYTFTNKADQKQFTATIKSIAAGKVNVEKDGRKFSLTITDLVDGDIVYLKKWFVDNPSYSVRVSLFREEGKPVIKAKEEGVKEEEKPKTKLTRMQRRKLRNQKPKPEPKPQPTYTPGLNVTSKSYEHYLFAVTNDSNVDLEGAEIQYKVFIHSNLSKGFGGSGAKITSQTGKITLPKVAIGQTVKVPSNAIALVNTASRATRTYNYYEIDEDGNREYKSNTKSRMNRTRPDIKGIWLRVYKDKILIKEVKRLDRVLQNDVTVTWY